ncbi:DUF930 domain-containing protein [Aquibium sp. ELW1220]|uniref:DUF930 domain-containing protein n=1 Tax=Aquibium sp. ELW1220 TaxID=2976766 RepID=UPI0025AFC46E|nr:DUF930 domain-containing protein [Aquibium sp. ELW1220]MDN2582256.1 DUF930 domain-containing protein [Aquibium sp. ELW1220]
MAGMPIDVERVRLAGDPDEGMPPWRVLLVSLALHLIVLSFAMLLGPERRLPPSAEQTVSVEILVEAPPAPPAASKAQAEGEPVAAPEAASEPPQASQGRAAQDGAMVRARTMLAARALADPRSREALHEWRRLYPDERIIQLCNLEAMEQVHAWKPAFEPDFVVAYAMGDIALTGFTLVADGAALRDHQAWYNMRYRCEVAADMEAVVAFEFVLGEAIPESEWAEHYLAADDGPAD